MPTDNDQDSTQAVYEIRVRGVLDSSWEEWFEGMTITGTQSGGTPVTVLTAPVADQSALRGMLTRLWDLNLVLESVIRVREFDTRGKESNETHDPVF